MNRDSAAAAYERAMDGCRAVVTDGIGQRFVHMLQAKAREVEETILGREQAHEVFRDQGALRTLNDILADLGMERKPVPAKTGGYTP